jgi:hypothetical protein
MEQRMHKDDATSCIDLSNLTMEEKRDIFLRRAGLTLGLLHKEAGKHFDPALVKSMTEIEELLHPIYAAFPDKQ